MDRTDDLLVPLVNAPHQRAAVERAVSADADVTVLNVVTPLDEPLSEGRVLSVTERRRADARARARRLVDDATGPDEPAVTADPAVDVVTAAGRPVPTVVDRVADRDVDRVVVGGPDRSALATLAFGRSVASVIDDRTDVPVTVVATDADAKADVDTNAEENANADVAANADAKGDANDASSGPEHTAADDGAEDTG